MNPFADVLLVLVALPGVRQDDGPRIRRDPGPRAEYFVLELPAADPAVSKPREVGAVSFRRRALQGGFQLEAEWLFRRSEEEGGDERVLHVEQLRPGSARLVWREWGSTRARSLSADRGADGSAVSFFDTGRGGTERGSITSGSGALMPLELLERIRFAEPMPATCERFDPLSRSLETVEVRRRSIAGDAEEVHLVRADGSTAGRYEFKGSMLQSFRWQEGDLVARRITEAEYRSRAPVPAVSIQRP